MKRVALDRLADIYSTLVGRYEQGPGRTVVGVLCCRASTDGSR
jgi:hypothetical protein